MKKFLLLSIAVLMSTSLAFAQRAVTGKVTSMAGGESLPGIAVKIKGTSAGTVADIDGNYRLEVPSDQSVLVFSFVGYDNHEETVGNRSVINVSLAEDIETLSEVVVTALGIEREKKALGYAVSEVSNDQVTGNGAMLLQLFLVK